MNQNPEQLTLAFIDADLIRCGWVIPQKSKINLNAALAIAVRKFNTDTGPADCLLFVDKKPIGIIEAKRSGEGGNLTIFNSCNASTICNSKIGNMCNEAFKVFSKPEGRWCRFGYEKNIAFDKTSADITWLPDNSLTDRYSLPHPDLLAVDIMEKMEAG